jgi:hypothetical protein
VAGESADDFPRWEQQLAATGYCHHPIRLAGKVEAIDRATGEARTMYDTGAEPGGVLLTACGNRREAVCPPCSDTYKRDARQLVRAGLAGGKGIPETITGHPCVFATLTAPSFGPVHARRKRGKTILPCRPRRDAAQRRCPHGRDISCAVRHHENDPRLGQALCVDCYNYDAAVMFNHMASELWRRFTINLPRQLAALTGVTQRWLHDAVAVRYVKVAEYQARGVVHFHAVIRLDEADPDSYRPPPPGYDAELLCQAIENAAALVRLDLAPDEDNPARPVMALRFGDQTDTKIVHRAAITGTGRALDVGAVANYIAKYVTKSLAAPGLPTRRITDPGQLDRLGCSRHHRQMITAAWRIGTRHAKLVTRTWAMPRDQGSRAVGRALADMKAAIAAGDGRLRKWAHVLGYGGHCLTKSRAYSVTFGQLRTARRDHQRTAHHPDGETDPWGRPLDDAVVLVLKTWTVTGTGHTTQAEADLAAASAARAREYNDDWPGQAA